MDSILFRGKLIKQEPISLQATIIGKTFDTHCLILLQIEEQPELDSLIGSGCLDAEVFNPIIEINLRAGVYHLHDRVVLELGMANQYHTATMQSLAVLMVKRFVRHFDT